MANVTIQLQNPYYPANPNCVMTVDEDSMLVVPMGEKRAGDVVPGDVVVNAGHAYTVVA